MFSFLALAAIAVAAFLGYLFGLGTGYRRGRLDEQRALLAELERQRNAARLARRVTDAKDALEIKLAELERRRGS